MNEKNPRCQRSPWCPDTDHCAVCHGFMPFIASSEVEAAEPTAGAVGVRSSAVVRPPPSGGQPERETGEQLRIRPPSPGQGEGSSGERSTSPSGSVGRPMFITENGVLKKWCKRCADYHCQE